MPLMGFSAGLLRIGLSTGICSHSPSDAFMIGGPLGSLTHAPSAAVSSLSASDGAKYRTWREIPGAMPWIACMSMFHSMLPLVSEKLPLAGTWTTSTGTGGMPCSASKACRWPAIS